MRGRRYRREYRQRLRRWICGQPDKPGISSYTGDFVEKKTNNQDENQQNARFLI